MKKIDPRTRFQSAQQDSGEGLIKFWVSLGILIAVVFWVFEDVQPIPSEFEEMTAEYIVGQVHAEEDMNELEESVDKVQAIEEDEQAIDFFYNRALKREKNEDYIGAVEDYEKTISMAEKYSEQMWNSLNNAGIIKTKYFKDYNGALEYFNKIISIETNRYSGEPNATRLESGYINRAYVKNMLGNVEGACDDLYEALGLGLEGSVEFIEKQIDKVCL